MNSTAYNLDKALQRQLHEMPEYFEYLQPLSQVPPSPHRVDINTHCQRHTYSLHYFDFVTNRPCTRDTRMCVPLQPTLLPNGSRSSLSPRTAIVWQVMQDTQTRYASKLDRAQREPSRSPRRAFDSPTKQTVATMKARSEILSDALEEDFPELYAQAAGYKRSSSPRKMPITVPRSSAPLNHRWPSCAASFSPSHALSLSL